jgi:hypothetical protein
MSKLPPDGSAAEPSSEAMGYLKRLYDRVSWNDVPWETMAEFAFFPDSRYRLLEAQLVAAGYLKTDPPPDYLGPYYVIRLTRLGIAVAKLMPSESAPPEHKGNLGPLDHLDHLDLG